MSEIKEGDRVVVNKRMTLYEKGDPVTVILIRGIQACVESAGQGLDVLALEHLDPAPPPRPEHPVLALFDEAVVVSRGSLSRHALSDIRAALAKRIEADPVEDCRRIGVVISQMVYPRDCWCAIHPMSGMSLGIDGWGLKAVRRFFTPKQAARMALANPPQEAT